MRRAIGLIAGPDKPPITLASVGRLLRMSIDMPVIVLISETASAPDAAAATAVGRASPLLGDSFTIIGSVVARRTAAVTSATACGSAPNTMPPARILGQETLTSMPATPPA